MTKRPPSVEAISLLSILLIHHVGFAGSSDADKTIVYIFFQRIVSKDYWVVWVNILLINHDLLYLQETNTHKSVLQMELQQQTLKFRQQIQQQFHRKPEITVRQLCGSHFSFFPVEY